MSEYFMTCKNTSCEDQIIKKYDYDYGFNEKKIKRIIKKFMNYGIKKVDKNIFLYK